MPVLINRQAVWFVSNDPNPLTAVPVGAINQISTSDEAFKTAYLAPFVLSREIKEAFQTVNDADQLAQMLDATGRAD